MIKPADIDDITWEVLTAANSGDVDAMRRLLAEDPGRSRNGYFYTPPIHFAVREGHLEIVRMLLDAGADSEWNGHYGGSPGGLAKDRGHDAVAALLEQTRARRGRTPPSESREDHPVHIAAQAGDIRRVRQLLDADPSLITRGDRAGGTPLHRATAGSSREVIELLLDRGADIHAIHGAGLGASSGFAPHDVQAIDIALWGGFGRRPRPPIWKILVSCVRYYLWSRYRTSRPQPHDVDTARLLLSRGATYDLTIAAALGDLDRVKA